jgi:hypothetical protein
MNIRGHVHYNSVTDVFDLLVWVEHNGEIVTAGLSDMSYQVYDRDYNQMTGDGSSGAMISPNPAGIYLVEQTEAPPWITNNESYLVFVQCQVGSIQLSTLLPFMINTI